VTLEYKLLGSGESALLCQGIERVYGTTYPIPEFYDPAFVAGAIEHGLLHCIVALSDQQVVACMSTVLEAVGDVTADGSALMVAPEFRGQGIVANLGARMVETYQRLELGGLHLYALALHDRVQKQSQNSGAIVTGVLPAWFSRRARVAGYDYPDARIGAVTLYMPLGSLPRRVCYLPPCYESVLSELYARLSLQRDFLARSDAYRLPATSRVALEQKTSNLQYRILLEQTGADLPDLLQQYVSQSLQKNIEVVYLDVPLSDPAAPVAVEAAREQGFCFGALMVDRRGCDRLRLQRYEQHLAAPEQMIVSSPDARALLDYVLRDAKNVHDQRR
jgi:hypothetical protein